MVEDMRSVSPKYLIYRVHAGSWDTRRNGKPLTSRKAPRDGWICSRTTTMTKNNKEGRKEQGRKLQKKPGNEEERSPQAGRNGKTPDEARHSPCPQGVHEKNGSEKIWWSPKGRKRRTEKYDRKQTEMFNRVQWKQ
uniref:hypothetical protein n=1 Tax=Salmonella sp. TaxID=599 RepID=UPI00399586E4